MESVQADDGKTATFDEIVRDLGDFGRYQRRVFFLMCLLPVTVSIQTIITVFTLATPDHRCAVPELPNDTYAPWGPSHEAILNGSIPWEEDDDDELVRSSCDLYVVRDLSPTQGLDLQPNRSTTGCHTFVYDRSTFDSTFTEEASLVCGRDGYHANADMIYMVGVLVGSIVAGLISDRFGRKKALMLSLVVHLACCIAISFVSTFEAFVALRFFIGVSNMGIFLVCYVLGLELVGDSYRTLAGSMIQMFWPVGLFIQTGVAYGVRDWSRLQLILSCPPALFLLYFWFVEESPRWLASVGRLDEANVLLQKAAKVNGKPPPKMLREKEKGDAPRENPLILFTNRTTLIRTLIIFLNWVVVTMVYYGLSLNVGNIGGSIYLNNFLSSLAELVGYIVALMGLDRLGRKVMHCGSMMLGGAACLASMFPVIFGDDSVSWAVILLSNVGKLGASASFSIIYLFSAELFPTTARNSMMGASSMVARIGGIVSPYIAQLNVIVGGDLGVALPLVVFGGAAFVAGLLALWLPETLHRKLPETVQDAIDYGNKKDDYREEHAYTNQGLEMGEAEKTVTKF